MKKMKTTLAATVALAACASTPLFAQNVRECTITFGLTVMQQLSVSTSATAINAGNFSDGPTHYKTSTSKMTQTDILKAIAYVTHNRNPGYYTTQAKLVLSQSELGGFWNVSDQLAQAYADYSQDNPYNAIGTTVDPWNFLEGTFVQNGSDANYNLAASTAISASGGDTYAMLDTGRHFLPNPITGNYPVGHMQPWGQIFVKDPGHKDAQGNVLCENVTFFFNLGVEECYDCFYLSSYITDANFTDKPGAQTGPPCCSTPSTLLGKGVDKYYMELSFDNTLNNPYLNPVLYTNTADPAIVEYYYPYVGFTGIQPTAGVADGTTPDLLRYSDPIRSGLGSPSPYEVRFTLAGIVTYSWNLQLINANDVYADFVGTANYQATGYGFIHLICSLLTGSVSFSEKIVKDVNCCDNLPWYSNWYGIGAANSAEDSVWSGERNVNNYQAYLYPALDSVSGYFNPFRDEFNPYPYYNIISGVSVAPWYTPGLTDQEETPYNIGAALTTHALVNPVYSHALSADHNSVGGFVP
jgi:hypothetical protein